ncbi:MAG: AEC family transporter, partial [Clostridia bacterium]|nr:AEC family transporter [Clostridia bacterium]
FGGGIGSFMGAFYVVIFNLFLWTWGILILAREREDIKLTPKKIFINYGTVPCAIGILLFLLQPYIVPAEGSFLAPAYDALSQFFNYLGSLCTPISVLVTGALLATMPLLDMFKNARLYVHSGIKLIVFPIILCLLAKAVGLNDTYILLVTAMAGVPSAAMVTMLAELHDIEPGYASQSVGMTSILSTATLPLVMLFAQWVVTW